MPGAPGAMPPGAMPPGAMPPGAPPMPGPFGPPPTVPASSLSPQDRWLNSQLKQLQKCFDAAQKSQAMKKQRRGKGGKGGGGDNSGVGQMVPDPILDEMLALTGGLPANIGPDPHTLGGKIHADKTGGARVPAIKSTRYANKISLEFLFQL